MKFGKLLRDEASLSPHGDVFIGYHAMKRRLKEAADGVQDGSGNLMGLKRTVVTDLETKLLEDLRRATTAIDAALRCPLARASAEALEKATQSTQRLAEINATGVAKIVKKMFKKLGYRPMELSILYPEVARELEKQKMIIEALSSHQPIASSARANSLELELSADPPGFGRALIRTVRRAFSGSSATHEARRAEEQEPPHLAIWFHEALAAANTEEDATLTEAAAAAAASAPAPAPAEAAVDVEEPPPSVDASSTRDIEMSAAGDSLPRLGAVPSRVALGRGCKGACTLIARCEQAGPPIFFVGSLLALVSCSLIQATAPMPVTWMLLLIIGVSQARALPHLPTESMYRRTIMLSSAFLAIANIVGGVTAACSFAKAHANYAVWCVVDEDNDAFGSSLQSSTTRGSTMPVVATAASNEMCIGLMGEWLLAAAFALVCVIRFLIAYAYTIASPDKYAMARSYLVSTLVLQTMTSVTLHVGFWILIIVCGTKDVAANFSSLDLAVTIVLGAPHGELKPFGVPYLSDL